MIVFSVQIVASKGSDTTILHILGSLLGPTRAAPGCISAHVFADVNNRNVIYFIEEWETRDQFEGQFEAHKRKMLVAAMELAKDAPLVHIDEVARVEGLGAMAALCQFQRDN